MIKVLIVDDSAVVRKVMSDELSRFDDIEIVGTAVDPYAAREKIIALRPDVITLDLEMPRMDGLSFLAKLMKHYPLPVVVLSSLTPRNSELAFEALALGAVEVLCKPESSHATKNMSLDLARAVRCAAAARITPVASYRKIAAPAAGAGLLKQIAHKVVAIGASTGGTTALENVLTGLPAEGPGIVIVQHMPEKFTRSFAQRLDTICPMQVKQARDGDRVLPGTALVAPGDRHMVLVGHGGGYRVKIKDGPRVHYQRPSVDVLFHSVAGAAGCDAVGVILTGMGADGAKGLLDMKQNGAVTLAQDEASCVVFGMPAEAIKLGAVDEVVGLQGMPSAILAALQRRPPALESANKRKSA